MPLAFASSDLDQTQLDSYKISGFTRPCCSFGLDPFGLKLGIAKVIDKDKLGEHRFARLNGSGDNIGMIYTCRAGFVDVSHLRDNADWSGHIFKKLPEWLGSGQEVDGRTEGGFKSRRVFFPKLSKEDLASLSDDDKEELAVSIGFAFALLHEIPTAFKIAVSAPATLISYETSSAFSLEDAFSNLLGNKLGAKAARNSVSFNQGMTSLLKETLLDLVAQPEVNTYAAYEMVRNDWWIRGFKGTFDHVLRRDFTYEGMVEPRRIENAPFCANVPVKKLSIPNKLSNGKSVNDYYEIRGEMNRKLQKSLLRLGVGVNDSVMTQSDFPEMIDAIKKDFVKRLGTIILKPN